MKFLTTIFATLISICVFSQPEFSKLTLSKDSSYGYTHLNPVKVKKGNYNRSINYSLEFLSKLRTDDNQKLEMVSHFSVHNPKHPRPRAHMTNRYAGTPVTGRFGSLDAYKMVTSEKRDTLIIYFDIHRKGDMKVPKGLKISVNEK
jgi:hypothetical protein